MQIDSSFGAFNKEHLISTWTNEMRKVFHIKENYDSNSLQKFSITKILDHSDSSFIVINHIVFSTFLQRKQNVFLDQPSELKYSLRITNFPGLKQIVQNEKAEFELSIFDETGKTNIESDKYNIIIDNDTLSINNDFEFKHTFNRLKPYAVNVWNTLENNIVHTDTINTVCKLPLQANITTDTEPNEVFVGNTLQCISDAQNYTEKESLKYNWLVNGKPIDSLPDTIAIELIKNDTTAIELSFKGSGKFNIALNIEDQSTCLSSIDTANYQIFVSVNDSTKEATKIEVEKQPEPKSFTTEPAGDPKPIIYKRNFRNWLWLIFLLPLLVWYLLNRNLKNKQKKIEKGLNPPDTSNWDSRPIELEFDNKGELINFGNSLKESSQLMRKKSELEGNRINTTKTANKSAQNYGWFSPVYQKSKIDKDFIVLIDSEFPDSHQTALFKTLTERLQSFQISLQVYYYSYYVDTLYDSDNNKYATEKILQNQPNAYVIIFGDAEALIDLNKLLLNRQSMDLFSRLSQKKAIVSPVAIKDWSAKEAILKTAFVVVPAELEAFNLMLQALITDIPVEEEKLLRLIDQQYSCIYYDFTELDELSAYLSQYTKQNSDDLLQWLCALAVYPKLNWSITLKLGAAIGKAMKIDILQYNTLLLMSRIKWLHDGLLKDNLRLQMLKRLTAKNEATARLAIINLLDEVKSKIGEKALANYEYKSQRALNCFFIDDKEEGRGILDSSIEKQKMRYWRKHLSDWPLENYIKEASTNKEIESLMPKIDEQKASSFKKYFEQEDELNKLEHKKWKRRTRALSFLTLIGAMFIFLTQTPRIAQPYDLFMDFNNYGNWCFGTLDTMDISFVDQNGVSKTVEKLDRYLKVSSINADENLGILKVESENLLVIDTIYLNTGKEQQKIVDSFYADIDGCYCPYNDLNTKNKVEVYCLNLSGRILDRGDLKTVPDLFDYSNLLYLDLSSNQIQKIENLDQLTLLERLDLSGNEIQKIENLNQLTQLKILYLTGNEIQKIENLDELAQLKSLEISYNQIQKIENLDQLTQLEELSLQGNQVQKIENLDELAQLNGLFLLNNQIQRIENLSQLKQLEVLYLNNNEIQKIENLDQLKQLEELHLLSNPISELVKTGIPHNPELILPYIKDRPELMAVYNSLVNEVDINNGKENTATTCSDGIDNDGDGLIDCEDFDCITKNLCNNAEDSVNEILLYENDFEQYNIEPSNTWCFDDLDRTSLNKLWGGTGNGINGNVLFNQTYTVETILINGDDNRYTDPRGIGGNYCIGMLTNYANNDDMLALTLDAKMLRFLNISFTLSSIDLAGCNTIGVDTPIMKIRIYDSPQGTFNFNNRGIQIGETTVKGGAPLADKYRFNWVEVSSNINIEESTNGNISIVFDLIQSGYAAFDNLRITAPETCNPSKIDLDNGLVAHYPFQGNATDVSQNTNNGEVIGAELTTDRFGNEENAFHFDGSSHISIADHPSFLSLTL